MKLIAVPMLFVAGVAFASCGVVQAFATLGSRREQPALAEGCVRALKLPTLPRTTNA